MKSKKGYKKQKTQSPSIGKWLKFYSQMKTCRSPVRKNHYCDLDYRLTNLEIAVYEENCPTYPAEVVFIDSVNKKGKPKIVCIEIKREYNSRVYKNVEDWEFTPKSQMELICVENEGEDVFIFANKENLIGK